MVINQTGSNGVIIGVGDNPIFQAPTVRSILQVYSDSVPAARLEFNLWDRGVPRGRAAAPSIASGLLCVPNLQTGEVAFRTGTDPKRHAASGIAELEIIHDETRLRPAMHI